MEDLLRDLVNLSGPSGFENTIAEFVSRKIKPLVDEVKRDSLGNLIAVKRGKLSKRSLLLNAHLDEIGFIVQKIEANGFLRFEKLGGIDDEILPARLIRITAERGFQFGVIGTVPVHLVRLLKKRPSIDCADLYIDVGASSAEEVRNLGIDIGSHGVFLGELHSMGFRRVVGKSLDNRMGCAVLLALLERLQGVSLHGDLYIAFTVQEEVGLRGATVAAYDLPPDAVAVSIDTTVATDTPEDMMDNRIRLGAGPVIQIMDAGILSDSMIRTTMMEVAQNRRIPFQVGVTRAGRTDAAAIQRTKRGIRTGVVSVPCRYTHSPVETIDLGDLEYAQELLYQFILIWL
ncbi:M42 family metallopeptidase [Effusibacillus dendaii]|uniref:Peptidase M42 n=1 Tax=Effusibacillus dendaii TaxID=2743772 RepID=A0A7I8DAV7_9BACL|nr:M42 family metallopeptidase [Effusibacillus dendaii]BCJ87127.1 peptidase M42 [Effusibacillus dendaii]